MKDKVKSSQGITIITLAVTVIVVLILIGISISSLSGDRGVLPMGVSAKENTAASQAIEQAKFEILEKMVDQDVYKIKKADLKTILKRSFKEDDVDAITDFSTATIRTKSGVPVNVSEIITGIEVIED